ncbi:hypothetical protein STANM309S_02650 [Streptomyces tanashiensis]
MSPRSATVPASGSQVTVPDALAGSGISAPYPNVPSTLVRSTRVARVTATVEPALGGAAGPSPPSPPRPSAPTAATAVTTTKAAATRTVRLRRRPGARGGAVPSCVGSTSAPAAGAAPSRSSSLSVNIPLIAQPLPGPCSTGSPMSGAQVRAACLAAAVVESHWTSPYTLPSGSGSGKSGAPFFCMQSA